MADQPVEGTNIPSSAADTTATTILTNTQPDETAAGSTGAGGVTADKVGAGAGAESTKVEGESKADGAEGAKPEDTKAGEIPEAYEFEVPEGMTLDTALVDKITPILKAKGFTQSEAQELVSTYAEQIAGIATAQQEAWKGQLETWKNDIQTDAEFGGTKFPATVKAAQTVIARYGDDQLKKELADYGVGNMPSLIRMLARAGKDMAEDNFHGAGGARGVDQLPPELTMFPTMQPKS